MRCSWVLLAMLAAVMEMSAVESRAEMLSNVAAWKLVDGSSAWSSTYVREKAVDDQLQSVTGYVSAKNATNVWWEVNLGQEFDLDVVEIYCRRLALAGDHINGAYLYAYDDTHTQIGSAIQLSGYYYNTGTDNNWIQTWDNGGLGWDGARYVRVADTDGVLNGVASGGALWLNELRALAEIPSYDTYITHVTAAGNMLYSSGTHADVQYSKMVDGAGMSDQAGLAMRFGDPAATAAEIHGGQWTSGTVGGTKPYLVFDLEKDCYLTRMLIWNRNAPALQGSGLKDVLIETSQDGATYAALADQNGAVDGNVTIAISPGGNAPYQADIDLAEVIGRYVRISALSSHGGTDWGLSEVRFYGRVVPEPGAIVLLATGLLVLIRGRGGKPLPVA